MKRFWKNSLIIFSFVVCFYTTGCIKSDINFANDMVEDGYKMKTFIDTLDVFKTYQCKLDSFPGNTSGTCDIGVWHSDSTGTVTSALVTNYIPYGFEDDTFFGEGAVMDSIKLTTSVSSKDEWGDSTMNMMVNVYRIDGYPFCKDSTYYTSFPIEKYIDPTPLCSFSTTEITADSSMTKMLPKWYAQLHYDNRIDSSNIYVRDDKFTNRINGLYFTAEPINPKDRRLLTIDLSQCTMRLYYHNNANMDTTLVQSFIFYNTSLSKYTLNFQTIEHDYTTAKPEFGGVDYSIIGDTLDVQNRTYVSCPVGLVTRMDIDTTEIYKLEEEAKSQGYNHVAILHASLRLKPVYADYKSMDKCINSLKLYYDIQIPSFMAEYNPILATSSSTYNSIGGDLVRSLGYYEFDITGYMQRLVSKTTTKTHFDVYPAYANGLEFGETYLGGSTDEKFKPELILVYSFLQ